MANPKRKTSQARRDKRRSHDALRRPPSCVCPECGEIKLPHRACRNCGHYRGREVIAVEEL